MMTDRTGELKLLENMSRDFAMNELREEREERDNHPFAPIDYKLLEKAKELGYFSLLSDEPDARTNLTDLGNVLKILSKEDASLATAVFTHSLAEMILIQAGYTDMTKLPDTVQKTAQKTKESVSLIAFPCFDFPSEAARLLRCREEKGKYYLSGKAEYLVMGGLAKWALLSAKAEDEEGFSFFLSPLDDSKIETSSTVLSLGLRACPSVDMVIRDVEAILIGEAGNGKAYYRQAAELLSAPAAAISLGVMMGSCQEAMEYAKQRFQGGRAIINWSEVRMILSKMALQCRSGEMLVDAALRKCEEETAGWEASAIAAALQVQEMACQVVADGVQVLGGNGYMKDYCQEKRFRDAHHLKVLLGHHPLRKLDLFDTLEKNGLS